MEKKKNRLLYDIAERAVWTYLQAFTGLLIASGLGAEGLIDLSLVEKASVAAITPVLAVIKGFAASQIGAPDSASTLPADVDPPQDGPHLP